MSLERLTTHASLSEPLPAAKRDRCFFPVLEEDDAPILDRFNRDLMDLTAKLQPELLSLAHGFAIDDGELGAGIEGDGGYEKSGGGNDRTGRSRSSLAGFGRGLPADRPEWIATSLFKIETRLVLQLDRGAGTLLRERYA